MTARFEPVRGGYVWVKIGGRDHRIFCEENGTGVPLLCLHTAGADSRQYRHLLNDPELASRFRMIAFDMPYHGRSTPPQGWWLHEYQLTMDSYLETIAAVMDAYGLERPIIMGCSMGGCVVLKAAIEWGGRLRGIVGLESAAHLKGRHQKFLHHPAVHGGEMCASWTYGLNAPQSPEVGKRENWWYYAQSGPGVYAGDTAFAAGFDLRGELHRIDTRQCKVSLLTGEYDYSATPAMTQEVADLIPGSRYTEMKAMGHFPISENYDLFKKYLMPELEHMLEGA
jgi:pimeloyl-ACP methyl ester carboxylesterase